MTPARYAKGNCLNIETNRAGYASNASQSDYRPASSQHSHKSLPLVQARILFSSDFGDGGSEACLGQSTILRAKYQPIIKKYYQSITGH